MQVFGGMEVSSGMRYEVTMVCNGETVIEKAPMKEKDLFRQLLVCLTAGYDIRTFYCDGCQHIRMVRDF